MTIAHNSSLKITYLLVHGMATRISSEAAGKKKPEAYLLGYNEDVFEPRAQLGAFFSIPFMRDRLAAMAPNSAKTPRRRSVPRESWSPGS